MAELPTIPTNVTVHLGAPNTQARNVTVPFTDYIKNVASSEIFPSWPQAALRANILAQISYTLNRVYTEYYPSRGYDFDITNDTRYDHAYTENGEVFDTVSLIVDELFNNYIRRKGTVEPLAAKFCDGRITLCDGLLQWGTVELANQGYDTLEILKYYYGDDIEIVENAPLADKTESYPGTALSRGSFGDDVRTIKNELSRIRRNYPAIPALTVTSVYDGETEAAVREFQRIFNLTPDGIVGKATWYQIKRVYTAVKRLAELTSEGLTIPEVERVFRTTLSLGDRGVEVEAVQYYLAFLGYFYPQLAPIPINGFFDDMTRDAVFTFQNAYGLPVTGEINLETYYTIERAYKETVAQLPANYQSAIGEPYPGRFLVEGDRGEEVRVIQGYLSRISRTDPAIPDVAADGIFGPQTKRAVVALQKQLGVEENGAIGPVEWVEIILRGNRV
ncbi:peptidoglycan-binding protein [uncultured Ruminococcus sp.]|uniref:peptidoglycan-binding protein n=1 Tax=uncultured Ruminococcus sp. TaxID=165186 RepID=UPI00292E3E53|nr:peptidoglycan-binding protein [uncultured Ruminococcus sp.]